MTAMTHSQLAATLFVDGCLANVAGNVRGAAPIEPVVLTELERNDIGLKQGGHTLFYPLPPSGVFVDLDGATATVWFNQADANRALDVVEPAMKRAFPRTRQLDDMAHPKDHGIRARGYEIDFGNGRMASVVIEYPERGAPPARFSMRVLAQQRGR